MKRTEQLLNYCGEPPGSARYEITRQMVTYGSPGYNGIAMRSLLLDMLGVSADRTFFLMTRAIYKAYERGHYHKQFNKEKQNERP